MPCKIILSLSEYNQTYYSDHLSCYPVYTTLHTDSDVSGLHRNASVSALMKLTPAKWQNSDKVMAMFIVTR